MNKWMNSNTLFFLVLAGVLLHLHACGDSGSHKHKNEKKLAEKSSANAAAATLQATPAADCDTSKWKDVYDRERLEVLNNCIVATGTIAERNADEDGDEHMLLQLDGGQEGLLKKKNYSKKQGCLVVEVVCVNNITRKRARGACDGYVNNVALPAVGDRVRVTGSYVVDGHNGWTEIHPVTKIEKLN